MSIVPQSSAAGHVRPVIFDAIEGQAAAGCVLELRIDGALEQQCALEAAATGSASAWRRFRVLAPPRLLDGRQHLVSLRATATQLELQGSPFFFRAGAATGETHRLSGNLVLGHARDTQDPARPVPLLVLQGDETIAWGVSDPARDGAFAIPLPRSAFETGDRCLYVAVGGSDVLLGGAPLRLPAATRLPLILRRDDRDRPISMAIKISAPSISVAAEWGDYHFALAIQKEVEARGWYVRVDCQDEWHRPGRRDDVVLALRGRHRYKVNAAQVNLLWIISHPDRLAQGELDDYERVFVCSDVAVKELRALTRRPVSTLHQATDAGVFRPAPEAECVPTELLFVGNSRKQYRTMIRWCIEQQLDVSIWGSLWNGIVPDELIRGTFIANDQLHRWYSGCRILLNDHWDTMRESGFLSNRLFDGSAAGAFIITDPVRGLAQVFGDSIETASSAEEFGRKAHYYLAHPEEAAAKAARARQITLAGHTFAHRAETLMEVAREGLLRRRAIGQTPLPDPAAAR